MLIMQAHIIQNAQSQLAQACCALRSMRRWAITGTPIQNKLTDFASIVRFLRVHPYSEQGIFDEEISKPWHRGDPQGFLRLKTLVRAITISRTKAVVHLPPRVDEIHHLDFAPAEREAYDAVKRQTVTLLQDAISSGSRGGTTFNALQRLNILRLICSHGLLMQSTLAIRPAQQSQIPAATYHQTENQDSFYGDLLGGSATCSQCGMDLLEDFLDGSPSNVLDTESHISKCGRMLCEQCSSQMGCIGLGQKSWHHRNQFANQASTCPSPVPAMEEDHDMTSIDFMSTKVKALVADIVNHYLNEKRFAIPIPSSLAACLLLPAWSSLSGHTPWISFNSC
jgi:SWI/SNF-related matrix-associated actin-dependent regulator of chromatin subfamily A3